MSLYSLQIKILLLFLVKIKKIVAFFIFFIEKNLCSSNKKEKISILAPNFKPYAYAI